MANRKNTFLLKRSNVIGKVPSSGDLQLGEIAINTADVILYASGTTTNSILPIGWDRVARSGDTMTGTLYSPSVSATTISASTYYGLPIDVYVTGSTYTNGLGNVVFTNNTGGTFTITGISTTENVIKVGKSGDVLFSSIKDAVDYITDSSENNPFSIVVGPGIYYEPLIDLSTKTNISIIGESILSVVIIPDGNHNIINVGQNTEISFLTLSGAPTGFSGIYCYDIGDFAQAHKLSFFDCDTNIWIESDTQETIFYGEYLDLNGEYSYGVKIIANNGFGSIGNFENYYTFPTGSSSQINNYLTGSGSSINILASSINGNNISGTTGVYFQDGAFLDMTSVDVEGCYYGIRNGNVGAGSLFDIDATSFTDSGLYDISIEHPSSVGSFQGSASHTKINNLSSSFVWNFLDIVDGELDITKKLSVTFDDGTHTDLSTLLFESSPMGLLEGGEITIATGLTINIASGVGYLEKSSNIGIISKVTWTGSSINISANSELYVYVNENTNITTSGTKPNTFYNILLGKVVSDSTSIRFIDLSPLKSEHYANSTDNFSRNALGPIYATGSIVTENVTPFHLDISQGSYYYGNNEFSPTGGTDVQFIEYSRNGMTGFTTSSTTVVNNTQYDNNGTLTGLTSSYFTKHSLYVIGEGIYEKYFLVLGQNEYPTLVEAESANLPTPPSYFDDAVTNIASIYIQEGMSGIIQIEDIRPIIGFKAGGVNASSVHGNLLGLDADDHVQYLLVDGSREMSGNLNIGNNAIISASTVNGVNIQTHASRHLPNGSDPLTTATPVNVSTINSEGIANSFARSDHQHAHGNLSGGTYHSVASTSIAGFMSSSDKTYLDSVPSLLNLKANLSGATFSGQINAPTISATTYLNLPAAIYVTGFTYSNNLFTITNSTGGTLTSLINTMTGLTVNGNLTTTGTSTLTTISGVNSLSANTITATTIINGSSLKPKAGVVSGGTFSGNPKKATVTFTTAYPTSGYTIGINGGASRTYTFESVSTTGFTINTNANGAFTENVHWQTMNSGEEL